MARQSHRPVPVPVLLTRPEPASTGFSTALRARFGTRVHPVISPLMAPEFLTPALPAGPFDAVIFTSATGVEAATRLGLSHPGQAWCVGARTARMAREAGFQAVSAEGDAEALLKLLLAAAPSGRLLHLRGEESRGDVAARLSASGIQTEAVVVYRQAPHPLSPEAVRLLQDDGPMILPIFSPRSAAFLLAALPAELRATLSIAAISAAAAAVLAGLPLARHEVAKRPDADGMLDAIGRLVESPAPP